MTDQNASGVDRGRYLIELPAGEKIFSEGDVGAEMYIVHTGEVEILADTPDGPRRLALLEKGDFFGEMSLFEDLPRMASAQARSPVKLVRVDRAKFDKMLRDDPEIGVRIMRKLSRRLREADRRIRESLKNGEAALPSATFEPPPLPPRAPARAPVTGRYRLVHRQTQTVYGLEGDGTINIGRRDPVTGIQPEVDLSAIDPERSSSRQHAHLVREGDRFVVVEDIGTTNGTFLNDRRLPGGTPCEIGPGDVLRFGLVDLEFVAD